MMKIVFMGTPDFAVPCLQAILDDGHEVCGVFTQPDKPKGRGYTLTPPPVKELALQYHLPVYQPKTLRTGEAYEILKELSPTSSRWWLTASCCPKRFSICRPWAV